MSDRPISRFGPARPPRVVAAQPRLHDDQAAAPRRPRRLPTGDVGRAVLQLVNQLRVGTEGARASQAVSDARSAVNDGRIGGKRRDG